MDSSTQQIKDRLSIVDVVGNYVQLKKAGRNMTGRCPFHKERTPSFFVSPERGTYVCFGCGEKGDIFSFVERMDGVDFKTALRQLAERAGVELPAYSGPRPEEKEKDEHLREVCEAAARFFEEELKKRKEVLEYLRNRGVADETIVAWRLGYAPASWEELSRALVAKGFKKEDIAAAGLAVKSEKKPGEIFDRFRGRIMFPMGDNTGRIIAFSGRFYEKVPGAKDDTEPAKYVNSPETALFRKSNMLYGFDKAKNFIRKADCILLVEGQFDLILCHQSGLPFTTALSGTALTPEHLSLLGRLSKRLVLALDADTAGLRSGLKSAGMALGAGFDVKVPTFPQGKDPADLARDNPELLKAAIRTSQTAVEFFLEALRPQAKDERAYKKLVEAQVLPLVAAIGSKIDQAHFVRLIAERLQVPEDAVRAEVGKRPTRSEEMNDIVSRSFDERLTMSFTPLERPIGMLLAHFGAASAVGARLKELLGNERVADVEKRMEEELERLRFEFDNQGADEEAVSGMLLTTVERTIVDEEMAKAKNDMRAAERSGDAAKAGELSKRLVSLAKRKQELRT